MSGVTVSGNSVTAGAGMSTSFEIGLGNVPPSQMSHSMFLNCFATAFTHTLHDNLPEFGCAVPGGQGRHCFSVLERNVPAGHGEH
eukprot:3938596-Rhodomonas_salina.5